jgi:hypothetical protein
MSDHESPPGTQPGAGPDDAEVDRALGVALDELVTAIQETKQAVWSASDSEQRRALDSLQGFLVQQAAEVANAEASIQGRSPLLVSPSGRRPPNLAEQAHGDQSALLALLVVDLEKLLADVRQLAGEVPGREEMQVLARLADGLEQRLGALPP